MDESGSDHGADPDSKVYAKIELHVDSEYESDKEPASESEQALGNVQESENEQE